jgi:hypothetical protein
MEAPKERPMTDDAWVWVVLVVLAAVVLWAYKWCWEEYQDWCDRRDAEREAIEELRRRLDEQDNGNTP